jgi:hypothetical protein
MTRDNCNETEQNVNTFSAWIEAGARGVVELGTAHAPEQALRPALSRPRTPDEITFAVGASQGRDKFVESYEGLTLTDLATMLTEHGRILHMPADPGDPKADLPLITASPSLDGRHADESASGVSLLLLDADGAGNLQGLRTLLTEEGIAHIWAWSSRCAPDQDVHKYHVIIPLAAPVSFPNLDAVRAWKRAYCFAIGALRKMTGLPADMDRAMASPCQPYYVGRRLTEAAPPREVTFTGGRCLDLFKFVNALGFGQVRERQEAADKVRRSRAAAAVVALGVDGDVKIKAAHKWLAMPEQTAIIAEGNRDRAAFRLISLLDQGFDLSPETVLALATDWNERLCDPPLDMTVIEEKCQRVAGTMSADGARGFMLTAKYTGKAAEKIESKFAQPTTRPDDLPEPTDEGVDMDAIMAAMAKHSKALDMNVAMADRFASSEEKAAAKKALPQSESGIGPSVGVTIPGEDENKAEIELTVPEYPFHATGRDKLVRECVAALAAGGDVYQRSNRLVTIQRDPATGQVGIRDMTTGLTGTMLSSRAVFIEYKKTPEARAKKTGEFSFPFRHSTASKDVIGSVLENGSYEGVPTIASITEAPQFRSDGTVQTEAGYDPKTSTYLAMSTNLPHVGTSPAEAVVAAKFLFDLLKHFQFTTPARARGI